ncbi:MAG: hypothetical protein OFPII_41780 [Osedax symbiont Rs1]|nr:MAG: hypothetical protein OFPII_41780 [Osedax symbiont Rs1]
MLILNCTKAAADFFSRQINAKKISPLQPAPQQTIAESIAETPADGPRQWHWLVHCINVKGKKVLIAMDFASRFSITLSAISKGDDGTFLNNLELHLIVHITAMLSAVDADPQHIDSSLERYRNLHDSCAFYLRGDRSVQTHINDVAWHFRNWVDDIGYVPTEVELIDQDVFVNQLLRKRRAEKDYFYPQHEFMHHWLKHYGGYNHAQADRCIAIARDQMRGKLHARHSELMTASDLLPLHSASVQEAAIEPDTHAAEYTGTASNVISLDAYRKR